MAALEPRIRAAALRDANLLITGETGVGKGRVARRIHALGPRGERPFVHVDCTALAPTLVESELFGHERGAFTDAVSRRLGRLERAGAGTLFLDEVGDLPLTLQAKLLRVLQDREFERVGGVETLAFRARIIAATHRDLLAQIEAGLFREDLFYRLDVLHLEVPPLRQRLDDLPALVAAASLRAAAGSCVEFGVAALERLAGHPWPGNLRELMNVVERCVAEVPDGPVSIDVVDVALTRARGRPVFARPAGGSCFASDRAAIEAELVATGGNVRRTARRLGVARSTLRYRIQRLRLEHLLPAD